MATKLKPSSIEDVYNAPNEGDPSERAWNNSAREHKMDIDTLFILNQWKKEEEDRAVGDGAADERIAQIARIIDKSAFNKSHPKYGYLGRRRYNALLAAQEIAALPPRAPAEDAVEAAARAIYIEMNSVMHDHDELWRTALNQNVYRDCARAALATPQPKPERETALQAAKIDRVIQLMQRAAHDASIPLDLAKKVISILMAAAPQPRATQGTQWKTCANCGGQYTDSAAEAWGCECGACAEERET